MFPLLVSLLAFSSVPTQPDTAVVDTITVRGTYSVDVEYPNIFLFLGAFITGAEPDSVVYSETWRICDSASRWLGSVMTADGSDIWFSVAADTNTVSFTEFPAEARQRMVADAIGVLGRFVPFLGDSAQFLFSGTFSHEWVPLRIVARAECPAPPNMRFVIAEAVSEKGPYLTGWIAVERAHGVAYYPSIRALFHRSDIVVTLTLTSLSIDRRSAGKQRTPR